MIKKYFNEKNTLLLIEVLAVFAVLFFGLVVFSNNTLNFSFYHNGDVHRGFLRGIDVWAGVNSYKAFNLDNMLTQEKVPGFFPLYFYVMAFFAYLSNFSFVQFIDTFRFFTFIFYSSIGVLIYFYLRKTNILLAILGMSVFMFNRWTLFDAISLKQESYVLLLLISSLLLLPKNKYLSFFLFGFATGIKHLTILIAPILLLDFYIEVIKEKGLKFYQSKNFSKYFFSFILFLSPIVIPSIWYFRDDPARFINSIFFNVTREPESDLNSEIILGLDRTLILYNQDNSNPFLLFLPRIPMILVLIVINIMFFKGRFGTWTYAALTYLAFISFNPTLFDQYMVWFFAFIPFTLKEVYKK